jgi:hypothetical protein
MSDSEGKSSNVGRAVRRVSVLVFVWLMASSMGGGCPVAHAQQYEVPQTGNYPAQVDPWEIIIYEKPGFTGSYIRYRMEPGMRQKLVPQIYPGWNNKVTSIQVGAKVAVTLYAGRNFYFSSRTQFEATFRDSIARVQVDYQVNSFIIYPKAAGAPMGIWLGDERWEIKGLATDHAFFPLPEWEATPSAGWPSLGEFNLDKNANLVWLPDGVVHGNSIGAVLFEQQNFQGASLILPGAGGWGQTGGPPYYDKINFGQLNWSDRAASLQVGWTAPPLNLGPPPQNVTLPVANAPPTFTTVYGMDLPGNNYRDFSIDGGAEACEKACAGDSKCKAYTWVKPGVQGAKAVCWLKTGASVPETNTNCVSGYSGMKPQSPPSPQTERLVSKGQSRLKVGPDLSGQWNSSVGIVYYMVQDGNQFEWTVAKTKEVGLGVQSGNTLSVSWKGPQGSGSSTGQITAVDPKGRATQIEWKNGVRFFR